MTNVTVLFLGPCRKLDASTGKPFPAFSPASRSGRFLRLTIETAGVPPDISVEFDNVIPRPVFDKDGRERNPSRAELVLELERHALWNLRESDLVVGLSAVVGEALNLAQRLRSASGENDSPRLLSLEHPSFMMRRPSTERADYARRLSACISASSCRERRKHVGDNNLKVLVPA
jgi:hypothetical protein